MGGLKWVFLPACVNGTALVWVMDGVCDGTHANKMHTCGNDNCEFMFFSKNIFFVVGEMAEQKRKRKREKSAFDVYICSNRLDLRTDIVTEPIFFHTSYTFDDVFRCECNAVCETYANIHALHANTRTRTRTQWSWCDSREVKNRNINFHTSVSRKVFSIFCGKFPYLCIDFNVQHVFIWFQFFNQFLFDWILSLSLSRTHFFLFFHSANHSGFFSQAERTE